MECVARESERALAGTRLSPGVHDGSLIQNLAQLAGCV